MNLFSFGRPKKTLVELINYLFIYFLEPKSTEIGPAEKKHPRLFGVSGRPADRSAGALFDLNITETLCFLVVSFDLASEWVPGRRAGGKKTLAPRPWDRRKKNTHCFLPRVFFSVDGKKTRSYYAHIMLILYYDFVMFRLLLCIMLYYVDITPMCG